MKKAFQAISCTHFLFHRFQSSTSNDVPGWETLSYTVDQRVFL